MALQHAIMELEQVQNEMQHNEDSVEGKLHRLYAHTRECLQHTENEWHKRYLEQATINSQLAQQIAQLETQLNNAREGTLMMATV